MLHELIVIMENFGLYDDGDDENTALKGDDGNQQESYQDNEDIDDVE